MTGRSEFARGTLRDSLAQASARALATGALLPIATGCEFVEDGGVRFFVRVLTNVAVKDAQRSPPPRDLAARAPVNPFLPYERELFVADVSDTHVAILNKFNVVDHHLLIITREFEEQRSLLTPCDFQAWWRCMSEYESLGFYNGGVEAGASQPHKHLQLVPLPLAHEGPPVPTEPLLDQACQGAGLSTVPGFDFLHCFARLSGAGGDRAAAREACDCYGRMLAHVGLRPPAGKDATLQSGPYCLLATRQWLLLVPRSREFFDSISINSLGFAGALLVRNAEQLHALRVAGPLRALRETALAAC